MAQPLRYCRHFTRAMDQWTAQNRRLMTPMFALSSSSRQVETRMVSSSNAATHDAHKDFTIRKARPDNIGKSNTLVVMFGFYKARESAIKRYCDIYHQYGFDVVYVKSVLKHFSWPKNSVTLSNSVLNYLELHCSSYDQFLVHAFSMGAYNFTVCLGTMYDKPDLYSKTQNKICGVVFDSLAIGSLQTMAAGVAGGVSKNILVRRSIIGLMHAYFAATHKSTVMFYDYFLDLIKEKPVPVDTLVFYCQNDTMSDAKVIEEFMATWKKNYPTMQVTGKRWDQSKHAAHLLTHREDYLETLDSFVRSVPALAKEVKPNVSSKL